MEHGVDLAPEASGSVKNEIKHQLWLALPMMGTNLVQSVLQPVSIMFIGHLGELELSSSSIATSFTNVTGYSLLMGLASSLETLCGQAYGSKQYRVLGFHMQRGVLVLGCVAALMSFLWYNLEPVLMLLHQDIEIAKNAAIYTRYLIPGLLAQSLLQPLNTFLLSQSIVLPLFLTSSITLCIHTLVCWTLVYKLQLGIRGAAAASSISNWLDVAFQVLIVVHTPSCRKCWSGFSQQAFKEIGQFLGLAIPSAVMFCMKWWCFEALVLISGTMVDAKLEASVFSITYNVCAITSIIPVSISAATSIRVSNELGAGRPVATRLAFYISVGLAFVNAALVTSTMLLLGKSIGKVFSNEGEVINYFAKMVPLVAVYTLLGSFQLVVGGALRGSGKQALAAILDFVAYYLVALPTAVVLCFHIKLGAIGLLLGLSFGLLIQVICYISVACLANWDEEAKKAVARTSSVLPLLQ